MSGRLERTWTKIVELGGAAFALMGVGFVIGALVVFGLHEKHWLPNSGTRQQEAFSEVPQEQAGTLAERFRPVLLFDSGERWRPLNVTYLFDEGIHQFCTLQRQGKGCSVIHSVQQFDTLAMHSAALGPSTFVDLAGGKVDEYHGPERCKPPLLDCGTGPRSAIYYHVTESNGRFYIDYWWFLRFNHVAASKPAVTCRLRQARESGLCDEHEGDWEGVTVVTPPNDEDHVDYVVYAAHKGTFRYSASQLRFASGTTRPYVYSAQGSHASYPRPCSGDCTEPGGLAIDGLVDLPEGRFNGKGEWARNFEACPANAPGSCLQSLTLQPWNTWPGEWGAGCAAVCGNVTGVDSPRSPALQARYQTPYCSALNGAFTCDGRSLHCSDWLGPLVAVVACDPAVLEKGLRATDAIAAGGLALTVNGQPSSHASTPGVVQALGSPLTLGADATVTADGPNTQILIRAGQRGVTVEDRFAGLASAAGQKLTVTVATGSDGPSVLVDGHVPVEHTAIKSLPVSAAAQLAP
ncbi:MAG TPA: Vps62-related protein [Solirubrobacteraceae bacterium]